MDEDAFSFASHRTELDMPVQIDAFKVVPFVAGTFGYDDRSGFTRTLVDGTNMGQFGEDEVWIGEAGVRASRCGLGSLLGPFGLRATAALNANS